MPLDETLKVGVDDRMEIKARGGYEAGSRSKGFWSMQVSRTQDGESSRLLLLAGIKTDEAHGIRNPARLCKVSFQ